MRSEEYKILKQRIIDEVAKKNEKGGLHYNSVQLAKHLNTDHGNIVGTISLMKAEGLVSSYEDQHVIFDESILSA